MYKQIGVFIPGRLKSERLPNKLILPLGESSLWEMACQKLNELPPRFNKYVLCYDDELIRIAEKYENIKVIKRDILTTDVDGPLNFIFKDMKDVEDTHLMFLNPCLSFLPVAAIHECLGIFEWMETDYATSVKPMTNWIFSGSCAKAKAVTDIDYRRLTTKEIIGYWQAAHCFHIFNKENFFEDGMMLKPGHGMIPITKEEFLIDVDTPEDYEYAKWKWQNELGKRYRKNSEE